MKRFRLRSVRARMVLLFIAVLAFVLIFIAIVASANFRGLIDREADAEVDATLTQAALHLEYLQNNIHTLAVQIASDTSVQKSLPSHEIYSTFREQFQMSQLLRRYMTQTDYVLGIKLQYRDGRTYTTASRGLAGINVNVDEVLLDRLLESTHSAFIGMVEMNYQGYSHVPAVGYAMRVNNYLLNEQNYATLVLFISPDYFSRQLREGFVTAPGVRLTDAAGVSLYEKTPEGAEPGDRVVEKTLPAGWKLSVTLRQGVAMSRYRQLMVTLMLVVLVFGALMAAVIIPMIGRLTAPIQQLTAMTEQVAEGNLDVRVEHADDDELGALTVAFAGMTEKLKQNIDRQLEQEKARNRLQMELQMARINPHFIYNTLDSVIWLARMGRTEEMIHLCRVFIAILQDTMHTDGEQAASTLGREIELVRAYEEIQSVRYEGRFTLEYHLDPAAEATKVPKLLLQPLVENALYHGILPDETRHGAITITTTALPGRTRIEIADDGLGMSPEVLSNLNSAEYVGVKSQLHSIGLSNIRKRLDLMMPGAYEFHLSSQPGQGTRIAITVPRDEPSGEETEP